MQRPTSKEAGRVLEVTMPQWVEDSGRERGRDKDRRGRNRKVSACCHDARGAFAVSNVCHTVDY